MPDYEAIKSELQERLRMLVDRVERIEDNLSETPDADWEEQAAQVEDDEVLSSVGNLGLEEVNQIKQALRQIEAGTYGICLRCKAEIPQARLEALPYATTCTRCA